MSLGDGMRETSAILADYIDKFGDGFPWPWLVPDLKEAERQAAECIRRGKPTELTYDDNCVY